MNAEQLLENVTELLGFRIQERENDAVLVRPSRGMRDSVRPATTDEVTMFVTILGLVQRLNQATQQDALNTRQNQALLHQVKAFPNELARVAEEAAKHFNAKLQHMEERAESAEEMASQMHAQLSDAEQKILELKEEVANLEKVVSFVSGEGMRPVEEEKS